MEVWLKTVGLGVIWVTWLMCKGLGSSCLGMYFCRVRVLVERSCGMDASSDHVNYAIQYTSDNPKNLDQFFHLHSYYRPRNWSLYL